MEETREQQALYRLLQFSVYASVFLEISLFCMLPILYADMQDISLWMIKLIGGLKRMPMYTSLVNSKLFTMLLLSVVSIGSLSKKDKDLSPSKKIILPFSFGLTLLILSVHSYGWHASMILPYFTYADLVYVTSTIFGTILMHIALDNISKLIASNLGKDRWNIEEESFMQPQKPAEGPYAVNIPMLFYYKKKVRKGWLAIPNIHRSTILIGTPGSGKSYSIVMPFIRQLLGGSHPTCLCLYDFKFPDLAEVAYYHYLLAKQHGKYENFEFNVINLTEVEKSKRINPLRKDYIVTLADASETAEALVQALKKGDKSSGSDQFFTQSAINFLAACIFFFSRVENGKYSTLPHVLAFLNKPYDEIFNTLFSEPELISLLSPFATAYRSQAYQQLEGQVGTLKIFISRLATKETFWVFSQSDFELKISDPQNPSILVLANDPNTQNINSTCYSVILNRLTRLLNSKGNLPSAIVVDEAPTLFIFKAENLIATSRSNRLALLLGLQGVEQFHQQYGKETAETILSIAGNILSGSVRSKETLIWLQTLFGKVKQQGESLAIDRNKATLTISEKLEDLIPAGKIAALKSGEIVGLLANESKTFTGKFEPSVVNCKINLDTKAIIEEERHYRKLPLVYDFGDKKDEILTENFEKINREVTALIERYRPKREITEQPTIPQNNKITVKNGRIDKPSGDGKTRASI